MKKVFLMIVGTISLGIGLVGIVVPVLPSFPFLSLTLLCYMRSSQKLHDWFVSTSIYKKHLEPFREKKGMTKEVKRNVMLTVTAVLATSFYFTRRWPIVSVILFVVWAAHILYFTYGVKTRELEEDERN